jgi:hypothetical protein
LQNLRGNRIDRQSRFWEPLCNSTGRCAYTNQPHNLIQCPTAALEFRVTTGQVAPCSHFTLGPHSHTPAINQG